MTNDILQQRIEKLEAQVNALQQLLLSHVVAFDAVDRDATDTALAILSSQRDSAIAKGQDQRAIRMGALAEDILKVRD